jgi:hypothetical protein
MEKTVKTRANHPCGICGHLIKIGDLAEYMEGKNPKFDKDDNQIGIEFYKVWLHEGANKCEAGKFLTSEELNYIHGNKTNPSTDNKTDKPTEPTK